MAADGRGPLTESQRHFNQSLLSVKVLEKKEAKSLCKKIQELYEEEVIPFNQFVEIINKRLEVIGLKISFGRLEQDGSEWMGLVNTISDSAAKKSSKMSQQNLEYFKTCLGLIAGEDSGWISSSMLLAAVDRLQKKMTKKNAQDFLRAQVADKWFIQEEGYYSMGPRSVLELFPFLPDVIDQPVDECHVCSVYVVMGQRCQNCNIKLHLYCLSNLEKLRQRHQKDSSVKCPQCHLDWEHEIPEL